MQNQEPKIEDILKMGTENDPNYDEIMETFKLSCPVKKINVDFETPAAVAGMWLMSSNEAIDELKELANLDNLNDSTFLFFTNQHILELSNILNGMIFLLEQREAANDDTRIHAIERLINLCALPHMYKEYKLEIKSITSMILSTGWCEYRKATEKIASIMELLPFISYKDIDDIASKAIKEFKDAIGENENETGNTKSTESNA